MQWQNWSIKSGLMGLGHNEFLYLSDTSSTPVLSLSEQLCLVVTCRLLVRLIFIWTKPLILASDALVLITRSLYSCYNNSNAVYRSHNAFLTPHLPVTHSHCYGQICKLYDRFPLPWSMSLIVGLVYVRTTVDEELYHFFGAIHYSPK